MYLPIAGTRLASSRLELALEDAESIRCIDWEAVLIALASAHSCYINLSIFPNHVLTRYFNLTRLDPANSSPHTTATKQLNNKMSSNLMDTEIGGEQTQYA